MTFMELKGTQFFHKYRSYVYNNRIIIDEIIWFNLCAGHNPTLKASSALLPGSTSIANE
jgi:hypothetical protein